VDEQGVSDDFHPEQYEDVVRSRMMALIEEKIDGKEISVPEVAQTEGKIVDLMQALKASVDGKRASASKGATPRKKAARAGRKGGSAKSTARSVSAKKTK